ncbi:branched-chain amino acid ABC transporter permease [Meiothermus granaticius]|uniref:Urea ABC transporter, permease protein UrtC n=1 Tax=Meiothermus granaticius NBRC 107808 TaxID=1227551 RepID=A0A399FB80_9DEIN|nr:branched-chain amino acid ABC transporter permease [Meiothermus granaticius]RIH93400.1 urea ABC transporter, permease protein UrtC [Meiothermus granaticius NBRC 107808]GEM87649.1 branched-chain amino acid ABC transporter permease [Meiothermus granaticius NBRC 107808]
MKEAQANLVVPVVAALASLWALLSPANSLANALLLVALALVALLKPQQWVRALTLAGLTVVFTVLIREQSDDKFAFYGLIGTLLSAALLKVPTYIKVLIGVAILFVSIPLAGLGNSLFLELGVQVAIFSALALGLNVVVGQAGLLDLGFAAFFAIGAYTWAIFGSGQANNFIAGNHFPLNPWLFFVFLPIAVVTAAIVGVLIGLPALRLRGDYLAIVTLGLGEVVRVLANNLDHPINLTNGPQGITPVGRPPVDWLINILNGLGLGRVYGRPIDESITYQIFFYVLALVVVAIVIVVNVRLSNSRFGRAWVAIREDEIAAKAMGIPLLPTKLLAFATGAAFSGVMGAIYGAKQTFVNPESFTLNQSIFILAMVILGGMGNIGGAVVGATAVTLLNIDILKNLSDQLNTWRQTGFTLLGYNFANLPTQLEPAKYERFVFGLILILMMIFRPEGLIPEQRHRAEMEEARLEAKDEGKLQEGSA